jgi:hypothetical protein
MSGNSELKTILIYDQLDAELKFFVLEGNYTHLNKVYMNSVLPDGATKKAQKAHDKLQEELEKLIYGDGGDILLPYTTEFPLDVIDDGLFGSVAVIVAGFLP